MPETEPVQETLQIRTLRAYTLLHHLRPTWGGQLILSLGLNPQGSAVALASNIAGAVCLSLEQEPSTAHAALRSGACDFVVNTLDEALRALKNEVRKHLPISVGLQGNVTAILQEILDRGLSPQLATGTPIEPVQSQALRTLQSQGTQILAFSPEAAIPGALQSETLLTTILKQNHWTAHTFPQPDAAALRTFDAQVLAATPEEDRLRRTWLTTAPRIFPRERPPSRTLWLTPAEHATLRKNLEIASARP